MTVNKLHLILTLIALVNIVNSENDKQKLELVLGQGFIIHLKDFGPIKNCWYNFGNEAKVLIDLKSTVPHYRKSGEEITLYTKTICGIRLIKLSSLAQGKWTLQGENVKGQNFYLETNVEILDAPKLNTETETFKEIGMNEILCSENLWRRSCRIQNGHDKSITDDCTVHEMIRNSSVFRCTTLHWGSMFESHETINVNIKERLQIAEANQIENDEHILMNCQFANEVHSCRAEYPNGIKQISIRDGVNSGKMSAFDTNVKSGKCVLEIRKPFRSEDFGIWRIYNNEEKQNSITGCIFYVTKNINSNTKTELIQSAVNKMPTLQTINGINSFAYPLEITCKAPFKLDNCYLRDPQNSLIFVSALEFSRDRTLGKCIFKNLKKIPGEWICGMSGEDYNGEVIQKFNLILMPTEGKAIKENMKIKLGGKLLLSCHSALNNPIHQCGFSDPKGNIYLASNNFNTKNQNRIKYIGRGLEYGECGIQVNNVKEDEFGDWFCNYQTSSPQVNSYKITVIKSATNSKQVSLLGLMMAFFIQWTLSS